MTKKYLVTLTVILPVVGMIVWTAGCCSKCGNWSVDHQADIPEGAIPAPVGTYVHQWGCAHASRADADKSIIYAADWVGSTAKLSPFAKRRLHRLTSTGQAISEFIIEPSESDQLDQKRQERLIEYLASAGVDTPEMVRIGYSPFDGVSGDDVIKVESNRMNAPERIFELGDSERNRGGIGRPL